MSEKTLIIAEKPNVGRTIVQCLCEMLGVRPVWAKTHAEIGPYYVTWAIGHLLSDPLPPYYDKRYKEFRAEDLPIVPKVWAKVVVPKKKEQADAIAVLMKKVRLLWHIGDPDREGQVIVDELVELFRFGGKVMRSMPHDISPAGIMKLLKEKPVANDKYRNWYIAGVTRARSDWLVGMNMSRAYTCQMEVTGGRALFSDGISYGRVQTPTLALVVERDRAREGFASRDYFVPVIDVKVGARIVRAEWVPPADGSIPVDEHGHLVDRAVADRISAAAKQSGMALVRRFEEKRQSKAPPLPYILRELLSDAGKRIGLTAKKMQDVVQKVYDHGMITYPRTDCGLLPEAQLSEAPTIMSALAKLTASYTAVADGAKRARMDLRSPAWVPVSALKDAGHTGIIPALGCGAAASLEGPETTVFDLVARRFIMQFFPNYDYLGQVIDFECGGHLYRATGIRVLNPGWTVLKLAAAATRRKSKDQDEEIDEGDDEAESSLPSVKPGERYPVVNAGVDARKTKPPSYFTEFTLITAMAQIHLYVQNPEIKKRLKENDGLGTEATRAQILNELVDRGFLYRDKKFIKSSPSGRVFYDVLPASSRDPGITALWESAFSRIEKGEMEAPHFLDQLLQWIRKRLAEAAAVDFAKAIPPQVAASLGPDRLPGDGEKCPSCKQGTLRTRRIRDGKHKGKAFLGCDRYPTCTHAVWPDRPARGDGVQKPERLEPLEGDGKPCPKCKKGVMRTRMAGSGRSAGQRFLGCSAYPKCKHLEKPGGEQKPMKAAG